MRFWFARPLLAVARGSRRQTGTESAELPQLGISGGASWGAAFFGLRAAAITRPQTSDAAPSRARIFVALLLLAVVCWAAVGCGKNAATAGGSTPAETAQAFADALNASDLVAAAALFDYNDQARAQNEDWDDIPNGQRELILSKLREQKAAELGGIARRVGRNGKCGPVVQGNRVTLTGDAGSVSLELREHNGRWLISGVW